MPNGRRNGLASACGIAALCGAAWLFASPSLAGPVLSVLLPLACALAPTWYTRLIAALAYYGQCSWPAVGAVQGYWGAGHALIAVTAWAGASLLLAAPWAFASTWPRALVALVLTALPPIGLIGWESPLNAAGVLFPGAGWVGVILTVVAIALLADLPQRRAHSGTCLLILGIIALTLNFNYRPPLAPPGWLGVDTRIQPARWNVGREIANWQAILASGAASRSATQQNALSQPVLVFGEGLLDDWYPGTRQFISAGMNSLRVPARTAWLIGASADGYDALVAVRSGNADRVPVMRAAAVLIGGDWLPWSHNANVHGLRPAWWERTFQLDGQRVWASICAEQLYSWTWIEALVQRPTLILAVSNAWWAPPENAAPRIQAASTTAWARLMGTPAISAKNR